MFSLDVRDVPSLTAGEQKQIWDLWEANMRSLVESSSFGWNPKKKRKELFHRNARFILVYDGDRAAQNGGTDRPIAFSMFRFERDQGEDLLYCYELQVSQAFRRSGLGHFLVDKLTEIGKHYGMSKIMLTVLKGNIDARRFYSKAGFELDPTSPEYESPSEELEELSDNGDEEATYDYEILSKVLR
ncbi:acyl-CoA N-acyltransferase [Trametes punicea]|nr:acyl-CoA N-acyltransferase [Trametes punicea]